MNGHELIRSFGHSTIIYLYVLYLLYLPEGLTCRSIRNFNIPPRAYPGHLTVHRPLGGGNLNVALEGWGI